MIFSTGGVINVKPTALTRSTPETYSFRKMRAGGVFVWQVGRIRCAQGTLQDWTHSELLGGFVRTYKQEFRTLSAAG